MKWFYNMSISAKLITSFMVVLALSVFLGVFSVFQLAKVNQTSTDMEINWMPSVRTTSDMNTNTSDFRINETEHILSQTQEEMDTQEKDMSEVLALFDKNRAEYEKLISSAEERKLYDDFIKSWNSYLNVHEKLMAISRQNKTEEAKVLLRGESRKLFDTLSNDLHELATLNVKGGINASRLVTCYMRTLKCGLLACWSARL